MALDLAVTTTFTLDLSAALVAPLAFAAHQISQSSDPIAVLEAVRHVTDRIDVFCQAGQIRVPATASDLMAFLEPMVHEVKAPLPGYLFHPKVWVVRYLDPDGEASYRLLCGTRNLTDDVSWDAVIRLDGRQAGRQPRASNKPLADLVRALPALAVRGLPAERVSKIHELAEGLRRVEWELPPGVQAVDFHALGLRRTAGDPINGALRGRRHLVVSPFLDDAGVRAATASGQATTLVSRPEALDRLDPATLQGLDCRIVSPLAGLEQPDEDNDIARGSGAPDPTRNMLGGLHAKVYVVEAGRQVRMLLGSANATNAGLGGGNVEFMVEILGAPMTFGIDHFTGPDAGFASILEVYKTEGGAICPPEESIGRDLEKFLRRIATHPLTGTVRKDGAGWIERIEGSGALDVPAGAALQIRLLSVEGRAVPQADNVIDATFEKLATADISPFVILEVSQPLGKASVSRSTVVRVDLIDDPPERFDEVIARQVDTPEKFLRFLALLLGLTNGLLAGGESTGSGGAWGFDRAGGAGLFELLIRSVADRPAAITDLSRLVERLQSTEQGRAVLPAGFIELWTIVRSAHEHVWTDG